MRLVHLCYLLVMLALPLQLRAAEPVYLHEKLEPFRPYLDAYFEGDLSQPDALVRTIDRSHWQRVLNGNAIRTVHSINDGEYGGESIIFWDERQQSLAYYYFTTAGFYTHGTMSFSADGTQLSAIEMVENNAKGITQVRSTSTFNDDGSLSTHAEYLQQGVWVPGHRARYERRDQLEIRFK